MPESTLESTSETKNSQVITEVKAPRLLCIDALRGFDMFWILGAEGLFAALFTITGLNGFSWGASQMLHSTWHGFTAYDLIFPLFIFLSGVSMGLSGKAMKNYPPAVQKQKLHHAIKRLFILLTLGVIYNHGWGTGMPASFDSIRYASVLGRIGVAWFVAAMLVWYVSERTQWITAAALLVGYWLLLRFVTIDGYGGGDFSANGALNVWFDQHLLPGVTYRNLLIDPEGLLSNLTSIVNALVGVFAGRLLMKNKSKPYHLLKKLSLIGFIFLIIGYSWGIVFPINKTLWTSSFVLVTCGFSFLLLAIFYGIIDVLKWQGLAMFFAVIGTNSIVVYLGTSLIDWQFTATSLFGGLIASTPTAWHELLSICALLLCQWLVLFWLYRQKLFIKI